MRAENSTDIGRLQFLLCAVFLTCLSLIAFEITLSRLLSVLLSYHYVFIVLSLALLGLGVGGIFVHFLTPVPGRQYDRLFLISLSSCLFSVAMSSSVLVIVHVSHSDRLHDNILFYCLVLSIPFLCGGLLLALLYRIFPHLGAKIYGVDLIGGAAGSLAVILFLNIFGGISTGFLLGVVASMAAPLFAAAGIMKNKKALIVSITTFLALAVLLGANLWGYYSPGMAIGKNETKEIHDALSNFKGRIISTKWSAFGRTDIIAFSEYPEHMDIYIDGTAGSPMYMFTGNADEPGAPASRLKSTFPGYFPFLHLKEEERRKALIIGPGGGRDVLLALMGRVQKITAVEVNRDIVDMASIYSNFNGGIYSEMDCVSILVDEGRHFLKRQKDHYDIIMLSLPVTNTSRSLEGYALTENFLFTTDSIHDYMDHLTDEGRLIVVAHDDIEVLRLLSIALHASKERGLSPVVAMNHVYIVGTDDYLVFVLKKKPFSQHDVILRYEAMRRLGLQSMISYFPHIRQVGALNPALMALGTGKVTPSTIEEMVRERGYDISAVTDDSPFFYKFEIGTPNPVSIVFWSSLVLWALMAGFSFFLWKPKSLEHEPGSAQGQHHIQNLLKMTVLFSMLGMGFMVIEISLIQRFALFLGQPVLSLAVLLFSLMGGAGLGSLWSGQLGPYRTDKRIAFASFAVALVILGYTSLLPLVFHTFLGLPLAWRLVISVVLLGPLGLLMGIPFPLGIRALKECNMVSYIPWMWGLNGVSSVAGSALTIIVAINLGFTEALLTATGCYLMIFFTFLLMPLTAKHSTIDF